MRDREWLTAAATFQKYSEFFLVCRAKTINELGKRLVIPAHLKGLQRDRLLCISCPVRLDDDFEKLLIEAPNVNLPFLSINHSLSAITGDMVARDLKLADKFIPKIKQH